MRRPVIFAITGLLLLASFPVFADAAPVTRRDGFLLIWESIDRPAGDTHGHSFTDLAAGERGFGEIAYAEARGLIDEAPSFRPDEPLALPDALVWLFRTRSVADVDEIAVDLLPGLLERYPIASVTGAGSGATVSAENISEEQLLSVMRNLDEHLRDEIHEVSLYSEKFHGKGTAFGETFDMYALTAAHRTFPHNTLVRVTNRDNGKSVTVRINDRGPFVQGRDMDLSLAAFLELAPRSQGVLRNVTFQRLGDANGAGQCAVDTVYQIRITRDVRLQPGVPHILSLGSPMTLHADASFVVRSVTYPDGNRSFLQDWVLPGETFQFVPSVAGTYTFRMGTKEGRARDMTVRVVECKP
ncbi:MAG: septal ring lytic transglycosylase RlpA family protein [Candidatus Peribacteraceae bacterium]|nr:septal ring lytic transglycosylase RlpA family protein [Candidatus Peribacteraceae bacterium]